MKKTRLLPLLVAVMMMATMAFANAQEADPIAVKVGDTEFTQGDAQDFFNYYYDQYSLMYSQYGLAFTAQDAEQLRDMIIDALVQEGLTTNKIAENNLGEITDEDKEALLAEAAELLEADIASYAEYYGMSTEEAAELYAAQGVDVNLVYEENLANLTYDRLYDLFTKDAEVTDERVEKEYETLVQSSKEQYENDAASYEMNVMFYGPQSVYYTPEGYRSIKDIVLALPEDAAAEISDIEAEMSSVDIVINALYDELYAMENETEEKAEGEEPRTAEQVQAEIDEQQAIYDDFNAKLQEARDQILPSLKPITDEIKAKYEEGASFDDLIAEYSTGDASETMMHKDSMSSVYGVDYRDAAMAIANIGDISEPILTSQGVHILQYVEDVQGGPVELTDELKDSLRTELQGQAKDEVFTEYLESWKADYEIETHPEMIEIPADAPQADPELTPDTEGEDAPEEVPEEDINEDGSIG